MFWKKMTILLVLILALGLTTKVTKADFIFGTPTNLGPTINTASGEGGNGGLSISADGLSIYFDSNRSGGSGSADLWVATRATKNNEWSAPVNLGSVVNSSSQDNSPSISADGLSLYFSSNRPGSVGGSGWSAMDLWVATRETTADDWGAPSNLGPVVNSSDADYMSHISVDGLSLYFSSERPGGLGLRDLWMTTRETTNDDWSEPVNLGPTVNTSSNERRMWISSDGLMLLFQSDRPRTSGAAEIYMTTRATTNDDWTEPVNLGPPVNLTSDISPIVSDDGRTLYFASYGRIGNYGTWDWDLWQAPIIPIVDLNGDGIVDSADMCIVVDNWGTDNQLCDVGPMPWGDGIVDVQDLIILAEHLFEEFPPAEPVE
jgi:Tol biopolymer transport system component